MAIKEAPVMARYGFIHNQMPVYIQFTQHFSEKWRPGVVVAQASEWYRLSFANKEKLLTKLRDPDALIKQVMDNLAPRVAEKHFEGLVAEAFTIGFSETKGFTVDAFDKRHLKLIEKHPASDLLPKPQDPTPSP